MAHFDDLSVCTYFGHVEGRLLAIGWLDPDHVYPQGRITGDFFQSLCVLSADPWQPFAPGGRHVCAFCTFSGGPSSITFGGVTVALGAANLFVPGGDTVYVAPSLIVHYVDCHGYLPPIEFRNAVRICPPMRSMAYLKAIRQAGFRAAGR